MHRTAAVPKSAACERCSLSKKSCSSSRPCLRCVKARVPCVPKETHRACHRCSVMKMACDKNRPCGRCVKSGNALSCMDSVVERKKSFAVSDIDKSSKLELNLPASGFEPPGFLDEDSFISLIELRPGNTYLQYATLHERAKRSVPEDVVQKLLCFHHRFSPFLLLDLSLQRPSVVMGIFVSLCDCAGKALFKSTCYDFFDTVISATVDLETREKLGRFLNMNLTLSLQRQSPVTKSTKPGTIKYSSYFASEFQRLFPKLDAIESFPAIQATYFGTETTSARSCDYSMNSSAQSLFEFSSEDFVLATTNAESCKPINLCFFHEESFGTVLSSMFESFFNALSWKNPLAGGTEHFKAKVFSKSAAVHEVDVFTMIEIDENTLGIRRTYLFIPLKT